MAEKLVEDWRAFIATNAAAKLAALTSEYDDGVALPTFTAVYRGQAKALGSIPEYPVALVLLDGVTSTDFTSTERGPGSAVFEGTYTLRTGVIARDPDPQMLELKVMRYVRCILELLSDNTAVPWGTAFDDAGTVRVQIGAGWAPKNSGDSILDAAIIHTVQHRELR